MAVVQAWPGRGFWQGGSHGALAIMVRQASQLSQPRVTARIVSAFTSLTAAHGLAVGPGAAVDALAAAGGKLTVYQATAAGTWRRAQVITVPIQYGSPS